MYNYQFNYFFKEGFIQSTPESVPRIMVAFDNKFLPTFLDEVSPTGVNKILRMVGYNEYSHMSVLFGGEVLSVQFNVADGKNKSKDEIFKELTFVNEGLLKIRSDESAYRISSVISFIEKANNDIVSKVYSKFFDDGNSDIVFEWNVRKATRYDIRREVINSVFNVSRATLMHNEYNSGRPFDGVAIEVDINTLPERAEKRFSLNSYEMFNDIFDFAEKRMNEIRREA